MNKKLPKFNADIGEKFDLKSIALKKTHSRLTGTFIICLFLGAMFVDLALSDRLPLGLGLLFTFFALITYFVKNYLCHHDTP